MQLRNTPDKGIGEFLLCVTLGLITTADTTIFVLVNPVEISRHFQRELIQTELLSHAFMPRNASIVLAEVALILMKPFNASHLCSLRLRSHFRIFLLHYSRIVNCEWVRLRF